MGIERIPDKLSTNNITDGSVTKGKFSKKIVHYNAGAPTAADDTGLGYAQGTLWIDTTNGDMYVCTAHTAEDASWANMEGDDINPPFTIQGSTYGYSAGGFKDPGSPNYPGQVDRYPLAAPTSTTDISEMATALRDTQSGSIRSDTYGYLAGGRTTPPNQSKDIIQRFAFSAPNAFSDIGELITVRAEGGGATDGSYGFTFGGADYAESVELDSIERFALAASPVTSADTSSELATVAFRLTGFTDSSNSVGYRAGGFNTGVPAGSGPVVAYDTIEKWSFNSPYPVSDYGELSAAHLVASGTSSTTHGYVSGGADYPAYTDVNIVEKYAFAGPASTDDVGDLTAARSGIQGASGDTHIYNAGGTDWGPSACVNTIDRNSTSADGNSVDAGELTEIRGLGTGLES